MNKIALYVGTILLTCAASLGQQYKVLYDFGSDPSNGVVPLFNPVADKSGNLYGVTQSGGAPGTCFGGCGVVFELSPNGHGAAIETVLYTFCQGGTKFDCPDGGEPNGLIIDSAGNLYGTTENGGTQQGGNGVAFELSPPTLPGGAWTYEVLYNFCSIYNNHVCDDGTAPYGTLTFDASGDLYGTTIAGGANQAGTGGVVFKLSPGANGWTESVLYNFCALQGCADSYRANQGVTFDKRGNLYGTTTSSGYGSALCTVTCGALFKLSPGTQGWTLSILAWFSPIDGDLGQVLFPGPVRIDPAGNLYTTLALGGNYTGFFDGNGEVLRVTPSGKVQSFLFDFSDGSDPLYGVILDTSRRALYGVTGGTGDDPFLGNVFEINDAGKETVLYQFCQLPNCSDGHNPSGLYEDKSGNLFGLTASGGAYMQGSGGAGVAFEITR